MTRWMGPRGELSRGGWLGQGARLHASASVQAANVRDARIDRKTMPQPLRAPTRKMLGHPFPGKPTARTLVDRQDATRSDVRPAPATLHPPAHMSKTTGDERMERQRRIPHEHMRPARRRTLNRPPGARPAVALSPGSIRPGWSSGTASSIPPALGCGPGPAPRPRRRADCTAPAGGPRRDERPARRAPGSPSAVLRSAGRA